MTPPDPYRRSRPSAAPRAAVAGDQRVLRRAHRALAAAFSDVEFDAAMVRCHHCVTDRDVAALARPVEAIDAAALARFVRKAGTTWGAPDDLRRVAPRALALAADRQLPVDRGLLWHKFTWAGWPSWPRRQVDAVHEFLVAEWNRLLRTTPRPAHAAHVWLGQHAAATSDLTPYLDAWDAALSPESPSVDMRTASGHLVLLVNASELRADAPEAVHDLFPGASPSFRPDPASSASGEDPPAVQLATWLAAPATAQALDHAAVLADPRDTRRTGIAIDRLGRFHADVARRHAHGEDPTGEPAPGPDRGAPGAHGPRPPLDAR